MAPEAKLQVSDQLTLPADAVTRAFAVLAMRGGGKSTVGIVLAEEMFRAGLPWVAIDPKGDWYGIRLDAAGTKPGLPVPVFGGRFGDIPLEPTAGEALADLIVEMNLTCIIDVSRFGPQSRIQFLTDFGGRLYQLHVDQPQARHVFLEEAHKVIPEKMRRDQADCVSAWSDVFMLGRFVGLGGTILSQRSAQVHKDPLSQIDTLIAGRTGGVHDRQAIRDAVSYHPRAAELVASLPTLDDGLMWVCSPQWLGVFDQVQIRRRRTFDSGATPDHRAVASRPVSLAELDLGGLRERLATTIERAEADDPEALRRRIAELRAQLAAAPTQPAPEVVVRERIVKVTVVDGALVERAEQATAALAATAADLHRHAAVADHAAETLSAAVAAARAAAAHPPATTRPASSPLTAGSPALPAAPQSRDAPAQPTPTRARAAAAAGALPRAHRAILTVLAQFPEGRTKRQLAILAGYALNGGGFNNALGALRTAGHIERGEPIRATTAGLAVLGDTWEPLPTGPALLDFWLRQLGVRSAAAKILTVLVEVWPAALAKEAVAARTEYAIGGGGFNNALGRLRTLELIHGSRELRADETLAQAARGSA
jgi:uncharacterized protein